MGVGGMGLGWYGITFLETNLREPRKYKQNTVLSVTLSREPQSMARNPKLFIHGTAVEITFRLEEGLYLVATPFMNVILKSCLARAQSLYSLKVCHLLVMTNHVHMVIVVESADSVKSFMQ